MLRSTWTACSKVNEIFDDVLVLMLFVLDKRCRFVILSNMSRTFEFDVEIYLDTQGRI